jgi:ankyrin repeat protein
VKTASEILNRGIDLDVPYAELDGAPPLFFAVLKGNPEMVQLLLQHGPEPNYTADEPVASIYSAKALNLARHARMLMDWEKYHAIVKLLERFGATDEDGQTDSDDRIDKIKAEAKRWQSQKQNT